MDPSPGCCGRKHDSGVPRYLAEFGHSFRRLEWVSEVVFGFLLLQPLVAVVPLGDLPDQRHDPSVVECHQASRGLFFPRCISLVQFSLDPDRPPEGFPEISGIEKMPGLTVEGNEFSVLLTSEGWHDEGVVGV